MKGIKKTFEEFKSDAIKVHGDIYAYLKENFDNKKEWKVGIICKEHGIFYLSYSNHVLNKRICPKCAEEKNKEKHRLYIASLLEKAKEIHNGKYSYDKIDLNKTVKDKQDIFCHIHGYFKMTLDNHINFKQGCSKCSNVYKRTFEECQELINDKFGKDRFLIIEDTFKSYQNKCNIKCLNCGYIIDNRSVKNHLSAKGCPICDKTPKKEKEKKVRKNLRTTENCIKEMKDKYGDKFSYEKFIYYSDRKKYSIVTCNEHGDFLTTFNRMMTNKISCPICSKENNYYEKQLVKFIKENIDTEVEENIRPNWLKNEKTNRNMELDIYLPKYKIAIEYQGRHHFVNIYKDNNSFERLIYTDKEKHRLCNELGIRLFYFTKDERNIPTEYFDKIYTNENELLEEIRSYIVRIN